MGKVLGLDLATRSGYSVISSNYKLLETGVIQLDPKSTHRKRFFDFYNEIKLLVKEHSPDLVVIEELHRSRNLNTTKLLAGFLAIALLVIPKKVEVITCHQATAKKDIVKPALGRAKLTKEDVFEWAKSEYRLNEYNFKDHNDITDSILMAHWGVDQLTRES